MITQDLCAFKLAPFTELQRLEGVSGGCLAQHPVHGKDTYSSLLRHVPSKVQRIPKDVDSMTSLGNMCQCLIFPCFIKNQQTWLEYTPYFNLLFFTTLKEL